MDKSASISVGLKRLRAIAIPVPRGRPTPGDSPGTNVAPLVVIHKITASPAWPRDAGKTD